MHSGKKWRSALWLNAMHLVKTDSVINYRKIPKIGPGDFSKTLFEGLIFGRAYIFIWCGVALRYSRKAN